MGNGTIYSCTGGLVLGVTEELSEFNKNLSWEALPGEVLHQGKRCLINYMSVALYSSRDPSLEMFLKVFEREGSGGRSTILGVRQTATLQNAALVNGFLGHLEDFDGAGAVPAAFTSSLSIAQQPTLYDLETLQ